MGFSMVKRIFVLLAVITMVGLSAISPLKAQGGGGDILTILREILIRVNDLPAALLDLKTFTTAWMKTDDSPPTTTMQGTFTELGNLLTDTAKKQDSIQSKLNTTLLNNDGSNVYASNYADPSSGSKNPATTNNLKYANDLVYSSLLDMPFFAKDPRSSGGSDKKVDIAMNYIQNASGLNLYHERPVPSWQGSGNSPGRYQGYFNTVMAATSFNAYVLSALYADKKQFSTLQEQLIKQASDPKEWFVEVGKENIGFVLRQLLLYQSQVFVLMTELVQWQKQMVTAQAINNALLVAANSNNENLLVSGAKGENPSL